MFKVTIKDDNYNKFGFNFKTLEEAKSFVDVVMNFVDKEILVSLTVKITYDEEYRIEGGE